MPAGTIAPERPKKIVAWSRNADSQIRVAVPRLRAWNAVPVMRSTSSAADTLSETSNGTSGSAPGAAATPSSARACGPLFCLS